MQGLLFKVNEQLAMHGHCHGKALTGNDEKVKERENPIWAKAIALWASIKERERTV